MIEKHGWWILLVLGCLVFAALVAVIVTQPLPFKEETTIYYKETIINNTIIEKENYEPTADCLKITYEDGMVTFHCKERE